MIIFRKENDEVQVYDDQLKKVLFKNPRVEVVGKLKDFHYEDGELVITSIEVQDVKIIGPDGSSKIEPAGK